MPNWCSNTVVFQGDDAQLASLKALFEQLANREKLTRLGQLPEFIDNTAGGYLFETAWENDVLFYQTKWAPNTGVITEIADHFGAGFVYSYDEPGVHIFGEASYQDGVLTDVFLDDEDYEQIVYDEEQDDYVFEGQRYESDGDILEALLERKKEGPTNNQYIGR